MSPLIFSDTPLLNRTGAQRHRVADDLDLPASTAPTLPSARPMEAVGARFGRSSSRYGITTVFSGPVRKWKKKWIHVIPSSSSSNSNHLLQSLADGSINGNDHNGSHLLLFKWTPISQANNEANEENTDGEDNNDGSSLGSKRRKYKHIPIAVLEEQKNETEEITEDDEKLNDNGTASEPTSKNGSFIEKTDINGVPTGESQNETVSVRQDLNISSLDLSLGLSSHEE